MTSETDKELLLRVAQAVCHEEQMTVWSGDFAAALGANGYLRDLSYDEVVELHQTIQLELQRIIASAMQHPEASRVLREAAEGPWKPLPPPNNMDIIVLHDNGDSEFIPAEDNDFLWKENYGPRVDGIAKPVFWMPLPPPPSPEPATHSLEGDR